MMKRILSLFTVLAMLLTCGAAFAATATETATVGTATVMGFGGEITVSVKVVDGVITAVEMSPGVRGEQRNPGHLHRRDLCRSDP